MASNFRVSIWHLTRVYVHQGYKEKRPSLSIGNKCQRTFKVNLFSCYEFFHLFFWSTNVSQSLKTPYEFYLSVAREAIHILITSNKFCEQKKPECFPRNYFSFWEIEKTNSVTVASQFPLFTCIKRIFYFWAQKKTLKSKPIWFNLS